jgi:hypothetical protein
MSHSPGSVEHHPPLEVGPSDTHQPQWGCILNPAGPSDRTPLGYTVVGLPLPRVRCRDPIGTKLRRNWVFKIGKSFQNCLLEQRGTLKKELPVQSITRVGVALQRLFGTAVDEAAEASGVIQRQRKFTALSLAQTFVLGFLAKPDASDEELAQMAVPVGAEVTPQAVEQRYTERLEQFLKTLLEKAIQQVVGSEKALAPLLERFSSVTIQDSSTIVLPDDLKEQYPGCGGSHGGGQAALKLQVEWDLRSGALGHVQVEAGRSPDGATTRQQARRGPGALRIADLGYFDLDVFAAMSEAGEYFLSRLQYKTAVLERDGTPVDLAKWLPQQPGQCIDRLLLVGKAKRLPCRVIAWRLPQEQAARRRQKLLREYQNTYGKLPSAARLALCDWTILVTNVPDELLSPAEAIILYRARWQIELLFKRWKSLGLVALLQGSTTVRQLVKVWARLLAVVVQHWLTIDTAWGNAKKSLTKVCRVIQTYARPLAAALNHRADLNQVLEELRTVVGKTCQRNQRSKAGTFELLNDSSRLDYGLT